MKDPWGEYLSNTQVSSRIQDFTPSIKSNKALSEAEIRAQKEKYIQGLKGRKFGQTYDDYDTKSKEEGGD
jgi:hypothetical protein